MWSPSPIHQMKIYTSFEAHIKCHPSHWFYSQNMHLFKLPQKMEFLFHSRPASCHAFYSDDYVSVCLSPGLVTAILQNCTIIIHISYRGQSSTFCIGNKYLRILKILDIFKLDNQIIRFSICSFHFSLFMVQVLCFFLKKKRPLSMMLVATNPFWLQKHKIVQNGAKWQPTFH